MPSVVFSGLLCVAPPLRKALAFVTGREGWRVGEGGAEAVVHRGYHADADDREDEEGAEDDDFVFARATSLPRRCVVSVELLKGLVREPLWAGLFRVVVVFIFAMLGLRVR